MKLRLLQRLRKTKRYVPERNSGLPKRLNWEEMETRRRQEGNGVLKGTNKRVVVVKSPDPEIFEQAIFIIREDYCMKRNDMGKSRILKEAQSVADAYIRSALLSPERRVRRFPPMAAAGIALAAALLAGLGFYLLHAG